MFKASSHTSLFQPATPPSQPEQQRDSSMEYPPAEEQRSILEALALQYFAPQRHLFKNGLTALIAVKGTFEPSMLHLAWSPHAKDHGAPSHVDILYVAATVKEFYHYLNECIGKTSKVGEHTVDVLLGLLQEVFCKDQVRYENLCLSFCIAEELTHSITRALDKGKLKSASYPDILKNTEITALYLTPLLNLVKYAGSSRAFTLLAQFFIQLLESKKTQPHLKALYTHFETEYQDIGAEKKLGAYAKFYRLYFLSQYLIVATVEDLKEKSIEEIHFLHEIKELCTAELSHLDKKENRHSLICPEAHLEAQYQDYINSPMLGILTASYDRLTAAHAQTRPTSF